MADNADLLAALVALETALHKPEVRHDVARLDALLHPDFLEHGRSGRVYRKADIMDALGREPAGGPAPSAWAFTVRRLGPQAALLTYRSMRPTAGTGEALYSLRCSVWQWQDGRWQMVFHQGTPTDSLSVNAA